MPGIKRLAKKAGIKSDVIPDIFEAIFEFIKNGERVVIPGFGVFERKIHKGRTVVSSVINDGEPTKFKSRYVMKFRPSGQVKRRLNIKKKKGKRNAKIR